MRKELQKLLNNYREDDIKSCYNCNNMKVFAHLGAGFEYCPITKSRTGIVLTCKFWVKQVMQHVIGNVKPEGIKHSNEVECMQKINGNFCFNCKFNQTYGCEKLIDRISVDDRAKYSDEDKRPDRFGTCDDYMKK